MSPYLAEDTLPGPYVANQAALLYYARARGATVYHAMGTCRMGTDPMAVVDWELRVHGISGIRIIDASVMPTMPSANTNAAILMIAEKGAGPLSRLTYNCNPPTLSEKRDGYRK